MLRVMKLPLTTVVLRYARDVRTGRFKPTDIHSRRAAFRR